MRRWHTCSSDFWGILEESWATPPCWEKKSPPPLHFHFHFHFFPASQMGALLFAAVASFLVVGTSATSASCTCTPAPITGSVCSIFTQACHNLASAVSDNVPFNFSMIYCLQAIFYHALPHFYSESFQYLNNKRIILWIQTDFIFVVW